ncbi:MAG: carbohydrate ABC transporter permease [Treponema sp.]|nr:carbohydrate ABC transporter permease [Treponema sp.]
MRRRNKYLEGPTIHHYKFRRKPNRSVGGDIGIYIFLGLCSVVMVFPLVFAIATSLKPLDELLKNPPTFFPRNPTFDNYSDLFVTLSQSQWVPFTRYVFNTVFITVVGTLGHVVFASMAAYVLAKYNFPGGSLFFRVAVVALMFSGYVTGIPNYLIMCRLHMVDTYWALILPAIGGSLGLFLMKQFMEGFPMSLVEAAKIDGANELTIFWKLVMPNVRPAWLTISIFSIQGLWNNPQTTYIYTEGKKMLAYALQQIQAGGIARTGQASAVIVFTMSVPIIFFIFSQSQIMETMATSGLKD